MCPKDYLFLNHHANTMFSNSFFMRSFLICSFLTIVFCSSSAYASKVEPEKTEDGVLEATIAVPNGLDINAVRECIGQVLLKRSYKNIAVADGKISGTYENLTFQGGSLTLTAVYSTTQVKLYGKTPDVDSRGRKITQKYYPQRWIDSARNDITTCLTKKVLFEKKS